MIKPINYILFCFRVHTSGNNSLNWYAQESNTNIYGQNMNVVGKIIAWYLFSISDFMYVANILIIFDIMVTYFVVVSVVVKFTITAIATRCGDPGNIKHSNMHYNYVKDSFCVISECK